jgi:uncharacterized membrane protein
MKARLRALAAALAQSFWLIPALIVGGGVLGALVLLRVDRSGLLPPELVNGPWLYDGDSTGARTLLGAVASSTIGVAGTVFSITIAALSLAAGQMGPRLLRNFTRDRANQVTLGIYLGTFSYALTVLRSARSSDAGGFVPHLALSIAVLLAFVCVAMLVFFVAHMAGRINVDTVIGLVSEDVSAAIARLTFHDPQPAPPPEDFWRDAEPVRETRRGYLQQLDADALADWAAGKGAAIRLLVRPGGFVFPGATIARVTPGVEGAAAAIRAATVLGSRRDSSADLEFALRQLVEVAVRALSPGINDPLTAISVIDRLGASLCEIAPLHLASGMSVRDGKPVLVVPRTDYDGLLDTMFHLVRQYGARNPAILIRCLEVLTAVVDCERDPARVRGLMRHAALVRADAEREIPNPSDLEDARERHARFEATRLASPAEVTSLPRDP